MIFAAVKRLAGDSTTYSITKMNEYDNYYISRRRPLPLPVFDGSEYHLFRDTERTNRVSGGVQGHFFANRAY